MVDTDLVYTIIALVVPLGELLGIIAAVHAVMHARTSQGAIAWAIALVTLPWLALVLYGVRINILSAAIAVPLTLLWIVGITRKSSRNASFN